MPDDRYAALAREFAGKFIARWRDSWSEVFDSWPTKEPLPNAPGVVTRLRMAEHIEREVTALLARVADEERERCLACIPGGDLCDPQQIADAIRAGKEEE